MAELIDIVEHEHDHLVRFFEDLDDKFRTISRDGLDKAGGPETLKGAREELRLGVEEMLHHFDQEEAVFFVTIEEKFPQMQDEVRRLIRMHEFICEQTQMLQKLLDVDDSTLLDRVEEVHDFVAVLRGALRTHARQENAFFAHALEQMSPDERNALLDEMQHI